MGRGVNYPSLIEKTIHFDNALEAAELTGNSSEILGRVERDLGVKLISRDTWVRLEGDADKVETANRFFQCLRKARNRGAGLPEQSILYTLDAFRRGPGGRGRCRCSTTGSRWARASRTSSPAPSASAPTWRPSGSNDIIFGIGPGRHRQDLPGHGHGGVDPARGKGQPHHPDPPGDRGRARPWASCPATCTRRSTPTCAPSTTRSTT